jgi:hypothetical protein
MVLADSHRTSRTPCYSGYSSLAWNFAYRTVTFYGSAFQKIQLFLAMLNGVLQPQRRRNDNWFGLFPFRSPLLRESLLFSFPLGTEMFHFPRFALRASFGGLPHSEINGYSPAYGSPLLIAVKPRPSSPFCAEASTICSSLLIRKSFIDGKYSHKHFVCAFVQ